MILAFDTETTGLPDLRQPHTDPGQPHLAQLAMILAENDGTERAVVSLIVRPNGYTIPAGAAKVHGITTERALAQGVPLILPLAIFSNLARLADVHVAHNAEFDDLILRANFHRVNREYPRVNARCTKNLATPILNLPPTERMVAAGFTKPKPPTLTECLWHLLNEELPGAHDALVDTRACLRVYLELTRRAATTKEPAP